MVIYTLPGPIYDYSAKLVKFDPDVIEFEASGSESAARSSAERAEERAKVTLKVKSPKGLTSASLSVTPSDSSLGAAVVTPASEQSSGAVVGSSFVLKLAYIPRGMNVSIDLAYQRKSAASAVATALLTADELLAPVSVELPI